MKKNKIAKYFLLVFMCFLISSFYTVLARADSDDEIVVLFDESHLSFWTIGTNPANYMVGGYSYFADNLTSYYSVTAIATESLSDAILMDVNILVIIAPHDSYTELEIKAIVNFVKSGGSILIISEYSGTGSIANGLSAIFGFNQNYTILRDSNDNTGVDAQIIFNGDNLQSHPINYGITQVIAYGVSGITEIPVDGVPIIVTDDDDTTTWDTSGVSANGIPIACALNPTTERLGKLVLINDANIWSNDHLYDEPDHMQLALNIFEWLYVEPTNGLGWFMPLTIISSLLIVSIYRKRK